MNCAVNAATTEQRLICRVDDRVNAQRRYVGYENFKPRRTDGPFGPAQADAGAPIATPLSASNCCNSPA
jgi:hypothetical protein